MVTEDVLKMEAEKLQVTPSERMRIEELTRKQRDWPLWFEVRFKQLIGYNFKSNFGSKDMDVMFAPKDFIPQASHFNSCCYSMGDRRRTCCLQSLHCVYACQSLFELDC